MDRIIGFLASSGTRAAPAECHGIGGSDADLDWEDWDPKAGSFVHHMIAGSLAGIAEHTVMYPVDTIKTFVQCQECNVTANCMKQQTMAAATATATVGDGRRRAASAVARAAVVVEGAGMTSLEAASRLVQREGVFRLWRGVSSMLSACVPAHAAYFSALESCKESFGVNGREHNVGGAAAAGAVATLFHDSIMTPMDVIKQRLQLGYYTGLLNCAASIARQEGVRAFYLSLPVTLFMNLPYGGVMVAANESIKRMLKPAGDYNTGTYLFAGSGAGALAAAATTPLDLIKTRLQTQVTLRGTPLAAAVVGADVDIYDPCTHRGSKGAGSVHAASSSGLHHPTSAAATPLAASHGATSPPGTAGVRAAPHSLPTTAPVRSHVTSSSDGGCLRAEHTRLRYKGILDAARQIHAAEGVVGFFRGMLPRLLVHTPSVAISWTTYETVKDFLRSNYPASSSSASLIPPEI
ncbi:mitoferrin-like protein [Nannochloropsis oceanica]